jgi:DNA-binding NarL/FixJ family response regulator
MESGIINLLIANDHTILGKGLGYAIQSKAPDKFSIKYTEDYNSTLDYLNENIIDIVIIDFQVPNGSVFDTITSIRNNWPETKIILNGMFDKSSKKYFHTLHNQIDGLLSFTCNENDYIRAIEVIMKGGLFFYIP